MYYSVPKKKSTSSRLRAMLLGALFLLAALSAIGFAYFRTNVLRITHASISGNTPHKELIAAFLIPRMPFFFLSVGRVKRELQTEFPQIRELKFITDVLDNNLEVSYTLREAHFLWCREISQKECYLVDANGVIFEKSDALENTFLTSVHDNYFRDVSEGKKIPPSYIIVLHAVEDFLGRRDLKLTTFTVNAPFSLGATFPPGVEMRFSAQKPIQGQLEKFAAFLSSRSFNEINDLTYIDLRIEDRIYYR